MNDPNQMDPKGVVEAGYDRIAECYAAWTGEALTDERARFVSLLFERLPAGAEILEHLATLAYKHAKNTFTLPGIGKLVLVNRPSRTMTMQFGPKKGQKIQIPAKKAVKFRVAKAAKDAILGAKKV